MPEDRRGTSNGGASNVSIVDIDGGLRIVGELTEFNANLLAASAEPALAEGRGLTLDLTDVTYIDAAALHVIAHMAERLAGRGRVTLKSPDPWVRKVISLVGVEQLSNIDVVGRTSG